MPTGYTSPLGNGNAFLRALQTGETPPKPKKVSHSPSSLACSDAPAGTRDCQPPGEGNTPPIRVGVWGPMRQTSPKPTQQGVEFTMIALLGKGTPAKKGFRVCRPPGQGNTCQKGLWGGILVLLRSHTQLWGSHPLPFLRALTADQGFREGFGVEGFRVSGVEGSRGLGLKGLGCFGLV